MIATRAARCARFACVCVATLHVADRVAIAQTAQQTPTVHARNCVPLYRYPAGDRGVFSVLSGATLTRERQVLAIEGRSGELMRLEPPLSRARNVADLKRFSPLTMVAGYRSDSAVVMDGAVRAVSIVGPTGTIGRSFAVDARVQAHSGIKLIGGLPDGSIVLGAPVSHDSAVIIVLMETGPLQAMWKVSRNGGGRISRGDSEETSTHLRPTDRISIVSSVYRSLGRLDGVDVAGALVVVAGVSRVSMFDGAGRLVRVLQSEPNDVTEAGGSRQVLEVRGDLAGRVWLERATRNEHFREWKVVDSKGVPLASMRTPRGDRLVEIGVDYVLLSSVRSQQVTLRHCVLS